MHKKSRLLKTALHYDWHSRQMLLIKTC